MGGGVPHVVEPVVPRVVPPEAATDKGRDRGRPDPHAFAGRGLMSVPRGLSGALAPGRPRVPTSWCA